MLTNLRSWPRSYFTFSEPISSFLWIQEWWLWPHITVTGHWLHNRHSTTSSTHAKPPNSLSELVLRSFFVTPTSDFILPVSHICMALWDLQSLPPFPFFPPPSSSSSFLLLSSSSSFFLYFFFWQNIFYLMKYSTFTLHFLLQTQNQPFVQGALVHL